MMIRDSGLLFCATLYTVRCREWLHRRVHIKAIFRLNRNGPEEHGLRPHYAKISGGWRYPYLSLDNVPALAEDHRLWRVDSSVR